MKRPGLALLIWAVAASAAAGTSAERLDGLYGSALQAFNRGDFAESEAVLHALAPHAPRFRRAWLALLFERQGYAALEMALEAGPEGDPWEGMLRARALANQGLWRECLDALQDLEAPEALALRAEALDELCDVGAEVAWIQALDRLQRRPGFSLASFKAGDLSLRAQRFEQAENRLKLARQADSAYVAATPMLASLYARAGRFEEAYKGYEKALRVDAADPLAVEGLKELLARRPELAAMAKAEEQAKDAGRALRPNPKVIAAAPMPGEPVLSVGLLVQVPSFKFKTASPVELSPSGLVLPADTLFEVLFQGKAGILRRVEGEARIQVAQFSDRVRLHPLNGDSTLALFDVSFGAGYFWASSEDRAYRGDLEFSPGPKGITVVNHVALESYLRGVLPAEMSARWPSEALKAQAINARADALTRIGRHKNQGFDICSEVHCAAYRGAGGEDRRSSAAVTATAGLILVDRTSGKAMQVNYMANCGGHTEDVGEIWGAGFSSALIPSNAVWDAPLGPDQAPARFPLDPSGLLDSLDDLDGSEPWCKAPGKEPYSQFRWVARYSSGELERLVARRFDIGRLLAVETQERSPAGYVKRLRFSGSKGEAFAASDSIRSAVKGLRSNFFYIETRRDAGGQPVEFLFHGGGWGHGVGFCQTGALGMALAGNKAAVILKHYFHSARIQRLY